MVAKIKSGKSLIGALNYNERKVERGKAVLIEAAGYHKDMGSLSFYDKLLRLTDLAARNERTKTNTVHISLNFPNGEALPDDKLRAIAQDYITGIGFETQPYLVYRHMDAGHPHIHIVSTNIKASGERISLHYLGQNQSEKARKSIEIKYSLVKAEEQRTEKPDLKAVILVAEYGKAETKRMITNILGYTLRTYKYTSLPELNAVLQQYHIAADRGSKDSRIYTRAGLVYWILDKDGNKTGVPIKASRIYGKPTLKTLDEKFRLNETLRKPLKAGMIRTLNEVLAKPQTAGSFIQALRTRDITAILRKNNEGRLYGATFIDEKNKVVFNGSDLGKAYSANVLSEYFQPETKPMVADQPEVKSTAIDQRQSDAGFSDHISPQNNKGNDELIDALFRAEREDLAALNKFKRKKRKGLNL